MTQESTRVFRFTISTLAEHDPRSAGYLADARTLGFRGIDQIRVEDVYFIEGCLTEQDLAELATGLLSDPVTQRAKWEEQSRYAATEGEGLVVEVTLRAGVTDPVAEQIVRAAQVMRIQGVKRASTGLRFLIKGGLVTPQDGHLLGKRLLSNPVIQRYELGAAAPSSCAAARTSNCWPSPPSAGPHWTWPKCERSRPIAKGRVAT